jgi:hypothetical protein
LEFQGRVQADGKYELFLPPGDFKVKEYNDRDGVRAVPVSIEFAKEARKEQRADFLKVPAPLRGKFVKEDGSDPGRLEVFHMSKKSGSLSARIASGGEFNYQRWEESLLIAYTDDKSLGIIYPVPDDKLGEFHTIVLKPMATVKLKLQVNPIVGQEVTASVGIITENSSNTTRIERVPSVTDESGVAEFKRPPGPGQYRFSWEGGEFKRDLLLKPGETVEITAPMVIREQPRPVEPIRPPERTLQDRIRDFFR